MQGLRRSEIALDGLEGVATGKHERGSEDRDGEGTQEKKREIEKRTRDGDGATERG